MDKRCPACNAQTGAALTACGSCGAPLAAAEPAGAAPRRRPRRRGGAEEDRFATFTEGPNRAALRAYRVSILGFIPGLGLLLGPLAVVLGALADRRGQADATFTAQAHARAAVLLGLALTLTNWLGLLLMLLGRPSR
jgi:hypothetical protein